MQERRDLFLSPSENVPVDCVNREKNQCRWPTERICRASLELLFSRDFLDRYNRYTKRQATFPKEQESRNKFLSSWITIRSVILSAYNSDKYAPGTWRSAKSGRGKNDSGVDLRSAICRLRQQDNRHMYSTQKIISNRVSRPFMFRRSVTWLEFIYNSETIFNNNSSNNSFRFRI